MSQPIDPRAARGSFIFSNCGFALLAPMAAGFRLEAAALVAALQAVELGLGRQAGA
jgi:hypothetical protein